MLDPANYTSSALTTAQMVRDVVNFSPNSYTGGDVVSWMICELYHDDFTPYLLTSGSNDATSYLVGSPKISFMDTADIQRTCECDFDGALLSQINGASGTMTCMMRLSRAYYDYNGNQIMKVPRGYFRFDVPDRAYVTDNGDSTVKVLGSDLTRDLQKIFPLHPVALPIGLNVGTAISYLLQMDNRSPSEGGRSPSGVALPGSPQAGLPSATGAAYTTNGIAASTFAIDPTNGYRKSPSGKYGFVFYNQYDNAYADSSTYAPIDPWTGMAMTAYPSPTTPVATVIWYTSKQGVAFHSGEGQFHSLLASGLLSSYVLDPFKMQTVPNGQTYKRPDVSNPPNGFLGTLTPALKTWPYDYDGSGPYYTSGGVVQTTSTAPQSGPFAVCTPLYGIMAQRYASVDTVLLQFGYHEATAGVTTVDPSNPGQYLTTPSTVGSFINDGPSISNWTFSPCTWTLSLTLTGSGYLSGGFSVLATIYEKTTTGYVTRGNLSNEVAGATSWVTDQASYAKTAFVSGSVNSFTAGAGSYLSYDITVVANPAITGLYSSYGPTTMSVTLQEVRIDWGVQPTVPTGTTFSDCSAASSTGTTPTNSGTSIPWPDSNYPALAPNGCSCYGANWPASRINLPATTQTVLTSTIWDRKTSLFTFIQQLASLAEWNRLGLDESGTLTTEPIDYWTSSTLPTIEWTFSNGTPQTDGLLLSPLTNRQLDQQNLANVIIAEANVNSQGIGLEVIAMNNAPLSPESFVNLQRREIKVITDDSKSTQAMLAATAQEFLISAAEGSQALELSIPFNPFFSRRNHINVQFYSGGALIIDGTANPFVVNSWVEEGDNPVQKIVCGRTIALGNGITTAAASLVPAAPTLTSTTTGGTMPAGTYLVEITYNTASGETLTSPSSSITVSGTTSTVTIDSPLALTGATGWFAYVTQAGGTTYTRQGGSIAIGTNLTLTGTPTSTGVYPPTASSTGVGGPIGSPVGT